ncbi:hypothetical protein OG613_48940 (plasmid) [Streptomyces sp. NBC_00015]|uniref:hypothetical protein n=1 Tax=Streptomyces sp. NBC_00015 TaxID=2903611 RepID=UPI002F90801F
MVDHQLAARVLRMMKQRTQLLSNHQVLMGTDRLEERAPLRRGTTLNVPGIIVYLSGYTITNTSADKDEDAGAGFEASKNGETGPVWDVAARLLGLQPRDQDLLFGHLLNNHATIAAFRQLADGCNEVDWSTILRN